MQISFRFSLLFGELILHVMIFFNRKKSGVYLFFVDFSFLCFRENGKATHGMNSDLMSRGSDL